MSACYVWFDAFPHILKVLDGYIVHCGIDYKPGLYKVNFRETKANSSNFCCTILPWIYLKSYLLTGPGRQQNTLSSITVGSCRRLAGQSQATNTVSWTNVEDDTTLVIMCVDLLMDFKRDHCQLLICIHQWLSTTYHSE